MARKSRVNRSIAEMKNEIAIWKAGFYGRLSVEDGDDTEQNSIGNQKKSAIITLSARMTSCLLTHIAIMAIPV